jgi:hypothetical protein
MAEDEQTSADIQIQVNAAMRTRNKEITQIKEEPNEIERENKTKLLVRNVSRQIRVSENEVRGPVLEWLD